MHDARARSDWNHTASILCLMANAHSGKGGRKFRVEDFHPMERRSAPAVRVSAKALRGIFGL